MQQIKSLKETSPFKKIEEFTLLYKLGEGSFSIVYLGVHIQSQQKYAIKKIETQSLNSLHQSNLHKEFEIHHKLHHPNIVHYYGIIQEETCFYLILEYCNGGNLFQFLVKQQVLSERIISQIFKQILSAIEFIHQNQFVLRDLKPENILIDNRTKAIKICDFGWASSIFDSKWLKEKAGTFVYMSPESLNSEIQGFETDVWALGVLLFELFYNKEPFEGQSGPEVLAKIKKGRIDFDSRKIPIQAKNLILDILTYEKRKRPTLQDVKNSDYVRGAESTQKNSLGQVGQKIQMSTP